MPGRGASGPNSRVPRMKVWGVNGVEVLCIEGTISKQKKRNVLVTAKHLSKLRIVNNDVIHRNFLLSRCEGGVLYA